MNTNPVTTAINRAGSGPKLGALLGCTGRAIYKWRAAWDKGRIDAVPAVRAIQIEEAVGVPRHCLRPDLWPEAIDDQQADTRERPAA